MAARLIAPKKYWVTRNKQYYPHQHDRVWHSERKTPFSFEKASEIVEHIKKINIVNN